MFVYFDIDIITNHMNNHMNGLSPVNIHVNVHPTCLREIDSLLGETTLSNLFCIPSKKGSALKGKHLGRKMLSF